MANTISPGAIVQRILAIYRDQAGLLLPTAVVLFAIQFVIALLLPGLAGLLLAIVFWVLAILYQGFVVELVNDIEDGKRDHTVGALVSSVTPVLVPLLAVSLLFAVGVGIGFVLIIIPGLFLMTIWAVVAPVTVLERPGIFEAFGRSRELVRGNGWNVFGVIVIMYVATVAISIVAAAIAAPLGHVGRDLVQWAVNVVLAPVVALSASVIFFALKASHRTVPAPGLGGTPEAT
jgi:hypothetical protein